MFSVVVATSAGGYLIVDFTDSAISYVTSGRIVNPLCACERERKRERETKTDRYILQRPVCLGSWAIDCV